jgi:hypothetical protein
MRSPGHPAGLAISDQAGSNNNSSSSSNNNNNNNNNNWHLLLTCAWPHSAGQDALLEPRIGGTDEHG